MGSKANESPQIRKARKKIQQQLEQADIKTTDDSLQMMKQVIERQLARHQPERIDLKSKHVILFDENQHPAKTESRFVARLMRQLKQPAQEKSRKQLEGRVKPMHENDKS